MLTVLFKDHPSGGQEVFQAESVEFIPAFTDPPDGGAPRQVYPPRVIARMSGEKAICRTKPDDPATPDAWREAFVMNEQGATVARYSL